MGLPYFSIVIPTYQRSRQLNHCLRGIAQIEYSREEFELVIVDDGSEEDPHELAAIYSPHVQLRLIRQSHAGPATARNTGAREASGKYVVFIDDDCIPDRHWLSALSRVFAQDAETAAGGRTINSLSENVCSATSQLLIDYLYDYYNIRKRSASFFASNNLAFPRERFLQIGGFDPTFPNAAGEDRELCDRWLRNGGRMVYAPDAIVYHSHPLTLKKFWRQHFNYGKGAYHYHCLRAKRHSGKIEMEPVSFYTRLLAFPFTRRQKSPFLTSFLLALSQGANAAGFYSGKKRQTG